jgi:hypothetical protein
MIIKLTKRLRFINAVIVTFLCNCTNSLDISLKMRKNQKDLPVKKISSIEINSTDNDKKIKEPELPLESKQIQDINQNKHDIIFTKEYSEENIEKVDFTILVLGQFESGKTTFCNLLTGRSIEDLPSTENFIMSVAKVGNKKIRIIDSPDYFLGEEKGPANKSLGLRDLVRENYDKLSKYVPGAIVYLCPYFPRFDKIFIPYAEAEVKLDFESYKDQTFLLVTCDKKMEVKDFQFQGFLKSPIRIPAERRFLLSKTDLEAGKFLSIDSFLERVQDMPKSEKSIWDTIKEYESPAEKLMKNMQSMEPLKKDCSNSKNGSIHTKIDKYFLLK